MSDVRRNAVLTQLLLPDPERRGWPVRGEPPDEVMMWKRNKEWSPEEVLSRQLAMNERTWAELQAHGVTEETQLRLDFFYEAPDEESAEALARFLVDETDYEVRHDDSSVSGATLDTTISQEILDQWVRWMVLAGHENGHCKFDGWGAAVP